MAANAPSWRCIICLINGIIHNCNTKHYMVTHLGSNAARHPNHSMGSFRCSACPFVGVRAEVVLGHVVKCIQDGHPVNHLGAITFRDLVLVATTNAMANRCALPHLSVYVAPPAPNPIVVATAHAAAVAHHAASDPAAATAILGQAAVVVPHAVLQAILAAPNSTAIAAGFNQFLGVQVHPITAHIGVIPPPFVAAFSIPPAAFAAALFAAVTGILGGPPPALPLAAAPPQAVPPPAPGVMNPGPGVLPPVLAPGVNAVVQGTQVPQANVNAAANVPAAGSTATTAATAPFVVDADDADDADDEMDDASDRAEEDDEPPSSVESDNGAASDHEDPQEPFQLNYESEIGDEDDESDNEDDEVDDFGAEFPIEDPVDDGITTDEDVQE